MLGHRTLNQCALYNYSSVFCKDAIKLILTFTKSRAGLTTQALEAKLASSVLVPSKDHALSASLYLYSRTKIMPLAPVCICTPVQRSSP